MFTFMVNGKSVQTDLDQKMLVFLRETLGPVSYTHLVEKKGSSSA